MLEEKRLDQIHGKIDGPLTLDRHTSLHGMVVGDVTVPAGIRLDHHGLITGDLVVEATGAAVVHGMVAGAVINTGGTVQVFGRVGTISDQGGRETYVAPAAKVGQ